MDLFLSFAGRIGRGKFWLGVLLAGIVSIVGSVVMGLGFGPDGRGGASVSNMLPVVLGGLVLLASAIAQIAVMIKRCHDRGKSGWWVLLALVPLVGAIWMIVDLGIIEGVPEANRWGPPAVAQS